MFFQKNTVAKRCALFMLNGAMYIADTLCIMLHKEASEKKGIAIIRLDGVGDFFMWLRHAVFYRQIYKDQHITLIADSTWAEFAATLPYWDAVIAINTKKLYTDVAYRWQKIREIRKSSFEIALEPTYSRVFLHGDSMLRATCATHKIGFDGDTSNTDAFFKQLADRWYTSLLRGTEKPMMELDRNAEFLMKISAGIDLNSFSEILPRMPHLNNALRMEKDYFVIFPGVSWSGKKWPSSRFAEVGIEIAKMMKWQLVVCGSTSERALCDEVIQRSGLNDALNLAGKTSLAELSEVIRFSKLLVGNDTAAIHIAALVETPSVCILGGGHFGRFLPYPDSTKGLKPVPVYERMPCYNCNWRCTQDYLTTDPVPCIAKISTSQVLEAVQHALKNE